MAGPREFGLMASFRIGFCRLATYTEHLSAPYGWLGTAPQDKAILHVTKKTPTCSPKLSLFRSTTAIVFAIPNSGGTMSVQRDGVVATEGAIVSGSFGAIEVMKSKSKSGESVASWASREKMRRQSRVHSARADHSFEDTKLRAVAA
jgi:hypothetical protein